jgi:hypothetical protein
VPVAGVQKPFWDIRQARRFYISTKNKRKEKVHRDEIAYKLSKTHLDHVQKVLLFIRCALHNTHNKVNIKIMHFLWPVITLRMFLFLPARLYILRHTPRTVIIFQTFYFVFHSFVHSNHAISNSTQFSSRSFAVK